MKRNTDLDLIRAILIILMILIHIVSFGNAYPHAEGRHSLVYDAYLPHHHGLSCEYREKPQADGNIPDVSRPTLRHHGNRFLCTLLFHARKRWHHGTLPLTDLREDIRHFHRSLLVYPDDDYLWHSLLYQFQGGDLGKPQTRKNDDEYHYKPLHLRHPTLAGIQDTRSFAKCRSLLFHRYSNSPMPHRVWQDIPSFPCSLTALALACWA